MAVSTWKLIEPEPVDKSARLYHYTSITCLPQVLVAQGVNTFWASSLRFLNDREEIAVGINTFREVYAANKANYTARLGDAVDSLGRTAVGVHAYSISFSLLDDDLGQWRGYADNGRGCSLAFEAADLFQLAPLRGKIIYDRAARAAYAASVLAALSSSNVTPARMSKGLQCAAAFMKHERLQASKRSDSLTGCHLRTGPKEQPCPTIETISMFGNDTLG